MQFFKNSSKKKVKAPAPRSLDEITKDYTEQTYKAGQAQYAVFVHTKDLDQINQRLLSLNQEAAARNTLDAKDKPQKEAVANEQV